MTVAELIAKLQEMPQEARVVIDGYEGGIEDVRTVIQAPILLDVRDESSTMEGNHELWRGADDSDPWAEPSERPADEIAVYLPRRPWP